ncbi:MAG: hypothetical protein QM790_20185 [Nibricoccus sp.]
MDIYEAFRSELHLWPPSEQTFDESLMKAQREHGIGKVKISPAMREELYRIYTEARIEELKKQSKEKQS